MKKLSNIITVLTMVMTAALWQSCSGSYPDLTYVTDINNAEDYETYPLSPSLNVNSLLYATSSGVASKAITLTDDDSEGPLDPQNNYENFKKRYAKARFYLLAYRKSVVTGDEAVLAQQPDFTKLMGDEYDRLNCLLSTERTYISGTTQHIGKLAVPQGATKDGSLASLSTNGSIYLLDNKEWEDNQNYKVHTYYWNKKKYEKVGYNFFAYYVNKANIYGFEKQNDCVKIDLELNGKNDIMVGSAPVLTEDILKEEYATSVTEDEIRKNILSYGDGAYSTYGAVHSVEPKIDLKHALAYIKFRARQMDDAVKFSIQDVQVTACTRGKLVVAARDLKNTKLGLTELSEPKDISVNAYLSEEDISTEEFKEVGEGILVPPAESYTVKVVIQQTNVKTTEDETGSGGTWISDPPLEIVCTPKNGFEAGKIYVLDLSVYGTTAITITSDLESWKSGTGTTVNLYD
ncbi:MAG: fimbrillin family protein [Prevotella sp.]|nr:fimbrillin family protein [Prevotella sp.]